MPLANTTGKPAVDAKTLEGDYYREILNRIKYRDEWRKVLNCEGIRWYFQWEWDDKCNFTGKDMVSRTAKYYLSPFMTPTEVVNRVFLAAVKAEEHETREKFMYRVNEDSEWRAPYNTHININQLYSVADQFDVRE